MAFNFQLSTIWIANISPLNFVRALSDMRYLRIIITIAALIGIHPAQGQTTNTVSGKPIQGRTIHEWFTKAEFQDSPPLRALIDAGPQVIAELSPLLQNAKTPEVQAKAAFVISCVAHHHPGSPEAHAVVPMLMKIAQSTNDDVRIYSAQALAAIGRDASNAIPMLVQLSKDPNPGVRLSAVDALGRVSPAVAALKLALSDQSSDVQLTARQALGILPRGGK